MLKFFLSLSSLERNLSARFESRVPKLIVLDIPLCSPTYDIRFTGLLAVWGRFRCWDLEFWFVMDLLTITPLPLPELTFISDISMED